MILTACHVVQMIDQGMIMDVDQFEPTMSMNNCNHLYKFSVPLRSADRMMCHSALQNNYYTIMQLQWCGVLIFVQVTIVLTIKMCLQSDSK